MYPCLTLFGLVTFLINVFKQLLVGKRIWSATSFLKMCINRKYHPRIKIQVSSNINVPPKTVDLQKPPFRLPRNNRVPAFFGPAFLLQAGGHLFGTDFVGPEAVGKVDLFGKRRLALKHLDALGSFQITANIVCLRKLRSFTSLHRNSWAPGQLQQQQCDCT